MAIYEINNKQLVKIDEMNFSSLGMRERQDLQQILKESFAAIDPDILIISEEFGDWEDSRRRIDLLGIDKNANLVVIELKRTEDGGHMDLQAIRYAAMISILTFEKVVYIYQDYLDKNGSEQDAETTLLDFLDWNEESEDEFAQDVRIILISANFSKEITTAVMWLLDKFVDIRCIRIIPYQKDRDVIIDVQQIIPLPEISDYQIQAREKEKKEKSSKASKKDYTKYDVTVDGVPYERLAKRNAVFRIVKSLCDKGVSPDDISKQIPWRGTLFKVLPGRLSSEEFKKKIKVVIESEGNIFNPRRRFYNDDELIYWQENTYALTNQWGRRTLEFIENLINNFSDYGITVKESENNF
ncbi:MAG: hypothetical protein R8G33_02945 [Gammaproteobacteria bacterium]|nr:hypothetical protein [Gammaproteobacteria bacterium]